LKNKLEIGCRDNQHAGFIGIGIVRLKSFGIEWFVNEFSRVYNKFVCRILPTGDIYYELEIVIKRPSIE
jgi:hypothetical protein